MICSDGFRSRKGKGGREESRASSLRALGRLISIGAVAAALSACVKASPHDKDIDAAERGTEETASFRVDRIQGKIVNHENFAGWGLPRMVKFKFDGCATDRRSDDALKGHKFEVKIFDGSVQRLTADHKGCFSWYEDVPINPLADAKGLPITRDIRATGMYLGYRRIQMVIFPWPCATCSPENVVDLRYGANPDGTHPAAPARQLVREAEVASALAGGEAGRPRVQRPLFLPDLFIVGTPDSGYGNGGHFTFQAQFSPNVQVLDVNGATSKLAIPDGQYHLDVDVVSVLRRPDGGERRIVVGSARTKSPASHVGGGVVSIEASTDNGRHVSHQNMLGRTEVVIRVTPVGGPPSLVAYEGLCLLNSGVSLATRLACAQVRTNASPNAEQRFSFDQYRASGIENMQQLEARNGGRAPIVPGLRENESFRVVDVRFMHRASSPGLARRTSQFDVIACFNVGMEDRPALGIPMEILKPNGQKHECRRTDGSLGDCVTDVKGCVAFPDDVDFQPYKPEAFIQRVAQARFGRWSGPIEYQINPWSGDADWRGSGLAPERWGMRNPNQEPSKFVLSRIGLKNQDSYRYWIDRFLSATLEKTIVLDLTLDVFQNNSFRRVPVDASRVKKGWYGVRFALEKEFYQHLPDYAGLPVGRNGAPTHDFVTAAQVLYHYQGGAFNPLLTIDVPDLGTMRLRTNAIVEVALLDDAKLTAQEIAGTAVTWDRFEHLIAHDAGLEPRTFVGSTIFLNESDSTTMIPTDEIRFSHCGNVRCQEHGGNSMRIGDLVKLKDKTFSNLLAVMHENERQSAQRKIEAAKLSNGMKAVNLDFIALADESRPQDAQRFFDEDPALALNNQWLPSNVGAARALVSRINATLGAAQRTQPPALTIDELRSYLALQPGQTPLAERMKKFLARLCYAQTYDSLVKLGLRETAQTHKWNNVCRTIQTADASQFYKVERKLRVLEVNPIPDENEQTFLLNFNAGADLSKGHGSGEDDSISAGVSGSVQLLDYVLGQSLRVFKAALGLSLNGGWSRSYNVSSSAGERLALGSQTYLGVDIHPMNIQLKKYQRCLSIQPRSRLIAAIWGPYADGRHVQPQRQAVGSVASEPVTVVDELSEKFALEATRGLFLCEGQPVSEADFWVPERYYFFSQQMSDGVMNDTRDRRANPWLLELRGRGDFLQFVGEIRAQSLCMGGGSETVDHGEGPIEQLARAFRRESRVPTIRGFYTVEEPQPLGPGQTPEHLRAPRCTNEVDITFKSLSRLSRRRE